MRGREKMGGGERRSVTSDTISAAHLFPLLPRMRRTIPRCAASSGTSFSPVNAVSATRSVERNLQRTPVCLRGRRHLHFAPNCYKKILLLHRRTIAYEPRPNISLRPPRPRTSSAGRRRLHAPSSVPIRGTRGDTPRPAPEGAPGNPRHRRFLPSFCPCGTCWPRGCAVLPSFGPWRGWLLLPDLHRHFRVPTNC